MSWDTWFLVACIVVACGLMAAGAVRAFLAMRMVKAHAQRIKPIVIMEKAAFAKEDAQRLQASLGEMELTAARLRDALASIAAAFRELKLAFTIRR
jgi:hypothetical protein